MPSRVIREGWVESEKIDQLNAEQERFFLRLCLRADDYGRFHGNHALLRSSLFPLKPDVRITDIPRWIAACETAGLIRCYSHDGKAFLEILRFEQRMRSKISKFPKPPSNDGQMTVICPTDDGHMRTETEAESNTESESNTETLGKTIPERPAGAGPTSDDEWLASLSASPAYTGIDVRREYAKAQTWCQTNRKQLSRRRFLNWLNRCDRPLAAMNEQRTWTPPAGEY